MAEQTYINTELKTDTQGQIRLTSGLDTKKDWVNHYLAIIEGEVPFSEFGNRVIFQLFRSNNEDEIEIFIDEIIEDIATKFQLNVYDKDVVVDNDRISIRLFLENDEEVNLVATNTNIV